MKRYTKPLLYIIDDDVIKNIKANAKSTECTPGCGGGTNANCGSTSYCTSQQATR